MDKMSKYSPSACVDIHNFFLRRCKLCVFVISLRWIPKKYNWRLTRITILTAIITSATADPASHIEIGAKMRANSSMLLMEKNYEIIFGNWTIGTSNTFDTHPDSTVYASNSLRKGYLEPKVKLSLSVNSNFKTYTADDECYDLP